MAGFGRAKEGQGGQEQEGRGEQGNIQGSEKEKEFGKAHLCILHSTTKTKLIMIPK